MVKKYFGLNLKVNCKNFDSFCAFIFYKKKLEKMIFFLEILFYPNSDKLFFLKNFLASVNENENQNISKRY